MFLFAALFSCRELMIYKQYTREEVLAAVRQDGMALKHFSHAFRSDREVVLAAVTQNGDSLEHASPALCGDRMP